MDQSQRLIDEEGHITKLYPFSATTMQREIYHNQALLKFGIG